MSTVSTDFLTVYNGKTAIVHAQTERAKTWMAQHIPAKLVTGDAQFTLPIEVERGFLWMIERQEDFSWASYSPDVKKSTGRQRAIDEVAALLRQTS